MPKPKSRFENRLNTFLISRSHTAEELQTGKRIIEVAEHPIEKPATELLQIDGKVLPM